MSVLEYTLFLGCALDEELQGKLALRNPHLIEMLLGGGDYLQRIEHEGQSFVGKFVGSRNRLAELELLEKNVRSILTQLVGEYSYQQHPLVLLTVPDVTVTASVSATASATES